MITVPKPHGRDRQSSMGEAVLRRAYANARRIGQVTVLSNLYEWERGNTAWLALYFRWSHLSGALGEGKGKDCRFTHITGLGRSSNDWSVVARSCNLINLPGFDLITPHRATFLAGPGPRKRHRFRRPSHLGMRRARGLFCLLPRPGDRFSSNRLFHWQCLDQIGTFPPCFINRIHSLQISCWITTTRFGQVRAKAHSCPIKVGMVPASSLNVVPIIWLNAMLKVVPSILLFFISTNSSRERGTPSRMPHPNDGGITKMAACVPDQAHILHLSIPRRAFRRSSRHIFRPT